MIDFEHKTCKMLIDAVQDERPDLKKNNTWQSVRETKHVRGPTRMERENKKMRGRREERERQEGGREG